MKKSSTLIPFIYLFLIPVFSVLPMWGRNFAVDNYTLILNDHPVYILPLLFNISWFLHALFVIGKRLRFERNWFVQCIVVYILNLLVMMVSYGEETDLSSQIHVFLGYAVFLWMSYLMFTLFQYYPKYRTIYYPGLLAILFVIMHYGCVNGIAEIIFTCIVSYSLYFKIGRAHV